MHDHNLDDLIIDNINPKNTKTKSFLTIIALAIIVLIVAIVLTKIVLKKPHNDLRVKEDTSEMISPELTLTQTEEESVQKPTVQKPEITKNTLDKPEPIIPTIISKTEPKPKPSIAPKIEIEPIKEEPTPVKISDLFNEKAANNQQEKNPIVNIPTIEENTNLYYIQVGSFSKTPSKRFLSIIHKSGFTYSITKASTNGIKKLLIGPYQTRSEIATVLTQVKDRINKSAFIIKK